MIPENEWKWFGMPMHFICICADDCRWHKATQIGDYIVSSVGDIKSPLSPKGGYEIGHNRSYETMVFKVAGHKDGCSCPAFTGHELHIEGSNDHTEADAIHDKVCLMVAKGAISSNG